MISIYRSVGFTLIASFLVILYSFFSYDDIVQWQTVTRLTARVTYFIFIALFIGRTFKKIGLKEENSLFLCMAVSHLFHLFFLLYYNNLIDGLFFSPRLLGGAIGFFLILLIPIISFGKFLGEKRLEHLKSFTILYLLVVFFMTYLPRLLDTNYGGGSRNEFFVGMGIVVTLIGIQLYTWIRKYLLK